MSWLPYGGINDDDDVLRDNSAIHTYSTALYMTLFHHVVRQPTYITQIHSIVQ